MVTGVLCYVVVNYRRRPRKQSIKCRCIKVEPDIDYFQDLGAHTLLQVIPNSLRGGILDTGSISKAKPHFMSDMPIRLCVSCREVCSKAKSVRSKHRLRVGSTFPCMRP